MIKRSGFARSLAVVVAVLVALSAVCGLSACAKADEDQIRGIIKESFEVIKNPSEDKLASYLEANNEGYDKLSAYGTDVYEFLKHSNAKLQYEIESIEIKEDKANIKLRLSNVDLAAASEAASKEITENINSYSDVLSSESAETDIMKLFMQGYYKYVDAASDTTTELVDIVLEKDGGSWKITDESYKKLLEVSMREVKI